MAGSNILSDGIEAIQRHRRKMVKPVAVITELGNTKLERPGLTDYQWRILNCISENGPSTASAISRETGIQEAKVRKILDGLESEQCVVRRSGGSM